MIILEKDITRKSITENMQHLLVITFSDDTFRGCKYCGGLYRSYNNHPAASDLILMELLRNDIHKVENWVEAICS